MKCRVKVGDLLKFYFPYNDSKLEEKKEHWSLVLFEDEKYLYISPFNSKKIEKKEIKKIFNILEKTKDNFSIFNFCWHDELMKIEINKKNEYPLIFPYSDSELKFFNMRRIEKNQFLENLIYKKNFLNNKDLEKINLKKIIKNYFLQNTQKTKLINLKYLIENNIKILLNSNKCFYNKNNKKNCIHCRKICCWKNEKNKNKY